MKKTIYSVFLLIGAFSYGQVGINNPSPKATLDVTAKITDGTKAEGFIAPRLTGDALTAAANLAIPVYGTEQRGTIVYVTAAATTPGTGQAENVTAAGYYYFDGAKWQKVSTGTVAAASGWGLTGNAGTTAGTNFLGTTDNQDLVFKRNNIQAGLLNNAKKNTAFGVGAFSGTPIANADAYPGSGQANVGLGYGALASNTTGFGNIAIGSGAAQNQTTAQFGVAIGHAALSKNVLGYNNMGIGWWALRDTDGDGSSNGAGSNNLGVGSFALSSNTTGSYNVALGSGGLQENRTGNRNTAVGISTGINFTNIAAGGSDNTLMGYNAGFGLYDGIANTALGSDALTLGVAGGSRNIAIGYKAGGVVPQSTSISSNDNILIGNSVSLPVVPGNNQMNIANTIFGIGVNTSTVGSGNIGINTTTPGASLEVNGITANTSGLKFTKLTSATPVTSGAAALGVDASGNVVVTTGSSAAGALNVTTERTTSYTATATDDIILLNPSSSGHTLTLPTTGIPIGKKYYISNKNGSIPVVLSPAPRETTIATVPANQGITIMYIGGTGAGSYSVVSGAF